MALRENSENLAVELNHMKQAIAWIRARINEHAFGQKNAWFHVLASGDCWEMEIKPNYLGILADGCAAKTQVLQKKSHFNDGSAQYGMFCVDAP